VFQVPFKAEEDLLLGVAEVELDAEEIEGKNDKK
jgi:hypothetical protein